MLNFFLYSTLWLMAWSLITGFVYLRDKRHAEQGRWRIEEFRLHALAIFGGWPGAYIAQRVLKHKLKHKFQKETKAIIVAWVLGLISVWYFIFVGDAAQGMGL